MRAPRRMLMGVTLFTLLGLLLIGPGSVMAGETITVKFGIGPPIDDPEGLGATRFAEVVGKKTDGRVKVQVFPLCHLDQLALRAA